MNKLIVIILAFSFLGCDTLCSITPVFCKNNLEEPEKIDFTQIDQFPQFKNCDELLGFDDNKACFEQTIYQKINEKIARLKLTSDNYIKDTLLIKFDVGKNGQFLCKKIKANDSLKIALPNITNKIKQIIHGLPPVSPAQKRGIPVTSTYKLPIVIESSYPQN